MTENKTSTLEGCLDLLGEPIYTDDFVAYSMIDHHELYKARVIGWTAKRIRISDLDKNNKDTNHSILLVHHSTRFIKIPKMMIMRLRMGLDLSEVNENTEDDNSN